MKKFSHIIYALLISIFPLLGLANDPKEGKDAEKNGETTLTDKTEMSVQIDSRENHTETAVSSKEQLMEINKGPDMKHKDPIDEQMKTKVYLDVFEKAGVITVDDVNYKNGFLEIKPSKFL